MNQGRRRWLLLLGLALLPLLGAGLWWWSPWRNRAEPELSPNVLRLLALMQQRLEVMPAVAKTKWREHRPIGDPQREEQLLDEMGRQAREKGLDPEMVRSFFAAQIEAGKRVQQRLFERWDKVGPPVDPATDLAELRRRLDRIGQEMLQTLPAARLDLAAEAQRTLLIQRARSVLTGPGVDQEVQDAALKPLLEGR